MKKKIEALLKRLQIAVRHNPAEVVLSVLFCCFGCALYETSWARLAGVVFFFPVFFSFLHILPGLIPDYLYIEFDDGRIALAFCLLSVCVVLYSVFLEGERFLVCFLLGDARSSATAVSGVRLETG